MKVDLSDYGVTELAPEEASTISGGWAFFGAIAFAVAGLIGVVAATILVAARHWKRHG
ncbi:hypothetical protein NKI77_31375 [Mesorhizobium opportunistum]|uniref:hypothetical protein n=1 Tax=Mesorhizobium TaxID=68287 RepID=UPI0012EB9371|nr:MULTISPECIES: hypothetical protein [unclassified Mesorhizobium]